MRAGVRRAISPNSNDEGDTDSSLGAADLTLRMSTDSWFKVQAGRSEGLVSSPLISGDGGFEFGDYDDQSFVNADAGAYRADLSVGLGDFIEGRSDRLTLYVLNLDAGYSAPGQTTLTDTETYGGTFRIPVTNRLSVSAKGDRMVPDRGLENSASPLVSTLEEKMIRRPSG